MGEDGGFHGNGGCHKGSWSMVNDGISGFFLLFFPKVNSRASWFMLGRLGDPPSAQWIPLDLDNSWNILAHTLVVPMWDISIWICLEIGRKISQNPMISDDFLLKILLWTPSWCPWCPAWTSPSPRSERSHVLGFSHGSESWIAALRQVGARRSAKKSQALVDGDCLFSGSMQWVGGVSKYLEP